jgi:hypothetical protein
MSRKDRWLMTMIIVLMIFTITQEVKIMRLERKMTLAIENMGMMTDLLTR